MGIENGPQSGWRNPEVGPEVRESGPEVGSPLCLDVFISGVDGRDIRSLFVRGQLAARGVNLSVGKITRVSCEVPGCERAIDLTAVASMAVVKSDSADCINPN